MSLNSNALLFSETQFVLAGGWCCLCQPALLLLTALHSSHPHCDAQTCCCPSILITGWETLFESPHHREKRQLWSYNMHKIRQAIQKFSQRCKNRKLGISYLEAKPQLEFEDKKGPNEKISWRLPTRTLGLLWPQSGASSGSPAAAMTVSVYPILCYKILSHKIPSSHGASHSLEAEGHRSSQQTQGNCCISMSWAWPRLFDRMKLLMSLTEVKCNRVGRKKVLSRQNFHCFWG